MKHGQKLRLRPLVQCSGVSRILNEDFQIVVSRREKIEAMLADEPQDTFLRYSLAMELCNEGQSDEGLALLGALTKDTPPYVPAFFRSAQILADAGQVSESRGFLRDGIETARAQGDLHAAAEMSEMLSDLGQMG